MEITRLVLCQLRKWLQTVTVRFGGATPRKLTFRLPWRMDKSSYSGFLLRETISQTWTTIWTSTALTYKVQQVELRQHCQIVVQTILLQILPNPLNQLWLEITSPMDLLQAALISIQKLSLISFQTMSLLQQLLGLITPAWTLELLLIPTPMSQATESVQL